LAHPSALSTIGKPFIELQSVDSTNNYARGLIDQNSGANGTAVFAHEQLKGKGQRGKQWISKKDENLLLSIIIEPKIVEIREPFRLTAPIALAALQLFSDHAGEATFIKWPNDLYWNDKKAGGILVENIISSNSEGIPDWRWAIAGIGININQTDFPADLPNPVSLKQITGKNNDPIELAKELCNHISDQLELMRSKGFDKIHEEYNKRLFKKEEMIRLKKGNRIFEARLKGVSTSGKLIVEHGIRGEFSFEEIEWIKESR
jgi:BirA family transcriptional regulator, biotin operon repressor / biotin---[acetyl-CoA-carboxylase] ligase